MKIMPAALALVLFTSGCVSTAIMTDLPTVVENPLLFRNKRVEITAPVIENSPPRGDEYRTWTFSIGELNSHRIMASEEGFNPSTIEKAYNLVEEARLKGDDVTITGRLRLAPYQGFESGMEIELDSVLYRNMEIRTDYGPYVEYYYPYYHHYYDPFYRPHGYYPHHRHYHYW